MPHRSQRSRRLSIIGTALAIGLAAFFLAVPLMSGVLAHLVPYSVEDKVGAEMIDGLAAEQEFCRAQPGIEALDRLVDRLATNSDAEAYHVYIVDGDVLNAFAAPGGHVVLFRPIIEKAGSAEEVAGVLAHEMAHVSEGHPRKGLVEAVGYGIFSLIVPGGADSIGATLTQAAITGAYSRGDELDADRVGVEMLNAEGIDSHGLNGFFVRLKDEGAELPGALEFLSTHPTGENRTEQLQDLVRDGEPAMSDADWEALRQICSQTGERIAVGS